MGHRYFKNRLRAGTALAAICAAGLIAPTPAYADCTLSGDGLTLTCTGDLSGGEDVSSSTITQINLSGLTSNIGGNGFSFINTTNANISFDANLGEFGIVLPDNAMVGLNGRRGFHIISGGQVTGTLMGSIISGSSTYDLTGAPIGEIEHFATTIGNPFTVDGLITRSDNFAAIGMTAQNGINLTHQGDINFSRSILDVTHVDGVQFSGGMFAGIRTENEAGNVSINNTGDILLDGGLFTANVANANGSGAIANHFFPRGTMDVFDPFRNSTFYGIFPFGGDDVTITQNGDITLAGGGNDWRAEANDSFAIASVAFSHSGGINVQRFHPTERNADGSVVQILTGDIIIDMVGDINISGDDVLVTATATSSGMGQAEGRAVATASPIPLEAGRRESISSTIGIYADGPQAVNVNLQGDIHIIGASSTAIATASLGGNNETSGEAEATARSPSASAIELRGNDINLVVGGAISVTGGDARAEITGVGREDGAFDFTGGGGARGGGVEGISVGQSTNADGDLIVDITGPINLRGGNAQTVANGSGYVATANGGRIENGITLSVPPSGEFTYTNENPMTFIAGDALLTINGTDISGEVIGGDAFGIDVGVNGDRNLDFHHSGDLTVISGSVHAVNNPDNMMAVTGQGGEAAGLLLGGNNSGTDRVTIDGIVNVTSGSATAIGLTDNLIGGFAAGVLFENGTESIIDVAGTVVATGGTGPDGIDELLGAGIGNVFGIIVTNSSTVNVSGLVEANGTSGAALISLHNDAVNGFFNVSNSGIIRGPIGIQITGDVDTIITNGGDIIGTGGTAIQLAGGDDIINHDAVLGSITGIVDGGGGNNIFNLSGGAYDITNVVNFGAVNVMNAGIAQGAGNFAATLNVADGGTLSPGGTNIGTLSLDSLVLADGAFLRFDLGAPDIVGGSANDLIEIAGELTLDGTLDIFSTPDFGAGIYRLFNYGGTLTDNGLDIGMAPSGSFEVQTSVGGQVNLIVDISSLEFWDGAGAVDDGTILGGSGVWTVPATNWTNSDGTQNGDFSGAFAIFMGDAGTVTVEGTQGVTGMQFATDGYNLVAGTNGAVSLNDAESFIRVDPGLTATLDVPFVGDGRLVKRDTGTLVLTGTNTHAGGTEVREGVIEISSDDNLGAAGAAFVFNGGTLRTANTLTLARDVNVAIASGSLLDDGGFDMTLAGMMTGAGVLTKVGTGTLSLTSDSSGFMGEFIVSEGNFHLDGNLGGVLFVQSGSIFSGAGTVGTLNVQGGTLAIGSSIGTLTTTGDVNFIFNSDFQVELAADGTSDFLNVGGAATIDGGTLSIFTLDPETSYSDGQSYTVLSAAGGLSGQFDTLVENSVFLDFTTAYGANDLVVTVEEVLTFPEVAQTFNQTQVSNTLMDLGQTAGSDSLAVYNALLMLDGDGARNAFDLSSGEIYAGVVAGGQRQARAHSDKLVGTAWRSGPDGLGAWGNLSTQDGKVELDGNGADLEHDRQAIDLGIDYRGADNAWLVGASAGWSKGDVTLAARNSAADTDNWQIGAYGRVGQGREGVSASAAITLGKGNADIARNISFPGINRTAQASTDTDTTALAAEARYGKQMGDSNWVVGPVASMSYAKTDLDRFAETGADALNLSGTASTKASVYGAGAFANWQGEKGMIDASLQYGTGSLGRAQASLTLDGASNSPFLVRAADHKNDRVIFKVRGTADLGNDWSLSANARAEWAAKDKNFSAGITARKRF